MENRLKLVLWFLDFDKLGLTNKQVQHLAYSNGIPMFLFYRKLMERTYKKDADINYYLTYLIKEAILDENIIIDHEFNTKLTNILKNINMERNLMDASTIDEHALTLLAKDYLIFINENAKESNHHKGIPLPDKNKGRPIINWLYCAHDGCCKKFKDGNDLISHLESFNCYIARYHTLHEQTVDWQGLTPEKIKKYEMTKCPAVICKESSFSSPEGLINHFERLGISPFWTKGMTVLNGNKYDITDYKYFKADECVICLDKRPDIVCYPCLHNVYCLHCYSEIDIKKCPMCRENIYTIYPYAT